MVRYIMTFSVEKEQEQIAKKIINSYFEALNKQGPGGMRSQCYSDDEDEYSFVHIKSFVRESVAREHFKSPIFNDYISRLSRLCESKLNFAKLYQEKTFESIY
jgi:quinol monooxygenase YgiN